MIQKKKLSEAVKANNDLIVNTLPSFSVKAPKGFSTADNGGCYDIRINKEGQKNISLYRRESLGFQSFRLDLFCSFTLLSCLVLIYPNNDKDLVVITASEKKTPSGKEIPVFNIYKHNNEIFVSAQSRTTAFFVKFTPLFDISTGSIIAAAKTDVSLSNPLATF